MYVHVNYTTVVNYFYWIILEYTSKYVQWFSVLTEEVVVHLWGTLLCMVVYRFITLSFQVLLRLVILCWKTDLPYSIQNKTYFVMQSRTPLLAHTREITILISLPLLFISILLTLGWYFYGRSKVVQLNSNSTLNVCFACRVWKAISWWIVWNNGVMVR